MDCKITFTKKGRAAAAFTLMELMIATGLGMLMLAVMVWVVLFGTRSFAAMDNYLDLDQKSEQTLDHLSREIRQADHLTAFASNSLSFVDNNGTTVQYQYDTNAQTLNRHRMRLAHLFDLSAHPDQQHLRAVFHDQLHQRKIDPN